MDLLSLVALDHLREEKLPTEKQPILKLKRLGIGLITLPYGIILLQKLQMEHIHLPKEALWPSIPQGEQVVWLVWGKTDKASAELLTIKVWQDPNNSSNMTLT